MRDPAYRSAHTPDGKTDVSLERRMAVIFEGLANPDSPRPSDPQSMLTFLQELWDRLSGR